MALGVFGELIWPGEQLCNLSELTLTSQFSLITSAPTPLTAGCGGVLGDCHSARGHTVTPGYLELHHSCLLGR